MQEHHWPLQPYRGFSYYTRDDAPLFAGREEDTIRCARFLAECGTRILMLHGSTGCGKSSFLRAGLIPFLESGDLGFRFIRSTADRNSKAVFVRSTDAPLCRLSECLYDFISRPLVNKTPSGPRAIRLAEQITQYPDCSTFCDNVAANLNKMLEVLHKVAKAIPQTMVIIIDQAEEVLTLKPGAEGQEPRTRFFDFLTQFHEMQLDMKLLIAIRTEYTGRFDNETQNRTGDLVAIPHFLLTDFTKTQIVEAIERPTSKKDIGDFGSPYNHYKFSYEESLPQKMADDLLVANPRGGILPVLQIVCDRLYKTTKEHGADNHEWIIREDDYSKLGMIEGQVDAYVTELLKKYCEKKGLSSERRIQKEIDRWKTVLFLLTREQLDGTATTQLKSHEELASAAREQGIELTFGDMIEYLANEEQRILRREEVTNLRTRQRIVCYSLGHDAIGLALHKWKISRTEQDRVWNRAKSVILFAGRAVSLLFALVLFAVGVAMMFERKGLWEISLILYLISVPFFHVSKIVPVLGRLVKKGWNITRSALR